MAENTEGNEFLTKLAMIADASQVLVKGKMTIVFQIENPDFSEIYMMVEEKPDYTKEEFKIEISGSDFIFMLDK
jgi:hypothetical protein